MRIWFWLVALALSCAVQMASAQEQPLVFATVDRPPFSQQIDTEHRGFSIDLMRAIAEDLGREVIFQTQQEFSDMLDLVAARRVDGAIANISITSRREEIMDFSQPIFAAGMQIMVPAENRGNPYIQALLSRDVGLSVLAAIGLLFGGGMLMWFFERRVQPYFDRPVRDAMFPSFWWALNLVVNGGFEERMPQSWPGRFFAVVLVVGSLFLVSIFVAAITASVTVEALQGNVASLNDLDGRRVGTVDGSTTADFLRDRDVAFIGYPDPAAVIRDFEEGALDAVVFDAPILAFYAQTEGAGNVRLLDRIYRPENYGIALPAGSDLREPINQSLLRLRETGTYDALLDRWFGADFRGG
ncbi:MAG: transporter substrate-binding domain-containing protein [Pseudomonadota bacterium]